MIILPEEVKLNNGRKLAKALIVNEKGTK